MRSLWVRDIVNIIMLAHAALVKEAISVLLAFDIYLLDNVHRLLN
jgi:hypothetical protein